MEILKKTSSGSGLIPLKTQYFEDGVIFLEGEVNKESAMEVCLQLGELLKRGAEEALLVIDSHGGSIQAGLAICDAIDSTPFKVHTYCPSEAYSMGALIFICGTGDRIMAPHAKLMLHEPLVKGVKDGSLSNLVAVCNDLMKNREILQKMIQEKTGLCDEDLDDFFSEDSFFDAKECQVMGMADRIGSTEFLARFGKNRLL